MAQVVVDVIPTLREGVTEELLKLMEDCLTEVSGLTVKAKLGELKLAKPNMSFTLSDFGNLTIKRLVDIMGVIECIVAKNWSENGTIQVIMDCTVVERYKTSVTKPGL